MRSTLCAIFSKARLTNEHSHNFFPADRDFSRDSGQARRLGWPALIRKRIVGNFDIRRSTFDVRRFPNHRHERLRDRDFMNAVFGERDADGVANAIRQERADADRALDPGVFAFTGFGHAEMNRIIPIRTFFLQARDEQAIGVDHHLRVARLHREDEGVVIQVARDPGELERAFHHPERRIAVAVHDPVGKRAVIRADAHRDAALRQSLTSGAKRSRMRSISAAYCSSVYSMILNFFESA